MINRFIFAFTSCIHHPGPLSNLDSLIEIFAWRYFPVCRVDSSSRATLSTAVTENAWIIECHCKELNKLKFQLQELRRRDALSCFKLTVTLSFLGENLSLWDLRKFYCRAACNLRKKFNWLTVTCSYNYKHCNSLFYFVNSKVNLNLM